MHRRVLLAVTVLVLALLVLPGAAAAQDGQNAQVTLRHSITEGPFAVPVVLLVGGAQTDPPGDAVAPGAAVEFTFPPGDSVVNAAAADNPAVALVPDLPISVAAGSAYVLTLAIGEDGQAGLSIASSAESGVLVFEHDVADGPTVGVTVFPFQVRADAQGIGTVAPGGTATAEVPVGTHGLVVTDEGGDDELGEDTFVIAADETVTVRASAVLATASPSPSPSPAGGGTGGGGTTTGAVDRPVPAAPGRSESITTPTRVEAGAGGATRDALVLTALLLAATGTAIAAARRRA